MSYERKRIMAVLLCGLFMLAMFLCSIISFTDVTYNIDIKSSRQQSRVKAQKHPSVNSSDMKLEKKEEIN